MAGSPMGGDAPIIRIVKKKKGHGGHHGGAWKVAYADFVTAMMAFFLVMWIVGLSKPVREAIADYFNNPSGLGKTGRGGSPFASGTRESVGNPQPLMPRGLDKEALEAMFATAARSIKKRLAQAPEFKNLQESVQIQVTDDGLRIELIEKTSSLFFDSGRANVKPATSKLLGVISKELGKLGNPIVIEGHTDSHPLGSKPGYSNWELSADRANAARRAMENRGVQPGQIVGVRGFADRKPKDPDNPFHPMNRRVSILVAYSSGGGFGESASKEKESAQETKESAPKESAAKEESHSGGEHSESSGHSDSESHESDH